MSSEQKVAIVTGGASGLGYAIAEKFVKNNIRTIIVGRTEQKLQDAKEQFGENCAYESFDLSKLEQMPQFVQRIHDKYGRIDILVNNAGINMKKPFTEVTDEEFERIILTNLTAVFSLSREVVKVML